MKSLRETIEEMERNLYELKEVEKREKPYKDPAYYIRKDIEKLNTYFDIFEHLLPSGNPIIEILFTQVHSDEEAQKIIRFMSMNDEYNYDTMRISYLLTQVKK